MGLFNLFKKENNKKQSINNSSFMQKERKENNILGNLIRIGRASDWFTEIKYNINLWGKEFSIQLGFGVNEENDNITNEQELSGKKFTQNINQFQEEIAKTIQQFFNSDNYELLTNSIELDGIHFSRNGTCSAIFRYKEDADDTLVNQISPEIVFDSNFGIKIIPNLEILPNEKALMDIYNY